MNNPAALPFCGMFWPQDARARDNFNATRALITRGKAPFGRDPHHDHITGSAFIYAPDFSRILLTHHRKLDRWLQLGGHCDGIADPRFVAQKEAYEESGLAHIRPASAEIVDIDIHMIPEGREAAHHHYDIRYAFTADPAVPLVVSDESHDVQWVALDILQDYTDAPSVLIARDIAIKLQESFASS